MNTRGFNVKNLLYSFVRLTFVFCLSLLVIYFLAFTSNAPDAYVLVALASGYDNYQPNLLEAIYQNIFLFDLAILTFNLLNLDGLIQYFFGVLSIYLIVFYLKYLHFFADLTLKQLSLVFVASVFSLDLNQFRFQLGLLFFLYSFSWTMNNYQRIILRLFSFFSHLGPIIVYYTAKFYYLPILLFPALLLFLNLIDSRYTTYLISEELIFYKTFSLIIPVSIAYLYYKRSRSKNRIAEFAISFAIVSFFFFPLNSDLSARFIETSFFLFIVWKCLKKNNSFFLGSALWSFAIAMFTSRLINGVSGARQDFIFTPFS